MHGDYLRRLERLEHFHHSFEIKGVAAVDRDEHNVDAADLVELLLGERVVKMAEMGDAQIRHLENENGIAVTLGAAAPIPDIRRDIAHAHVANANIVTCRLIRCRPPAAQDVLDRRVGAIGVMGAVRVVHGDDVWHDRRTDIVVIVGHDAYELRALDQKT